MKNLLIAVMLIISGSVYSQIKSVDRINNDVTEVQEHNQTMLFVSDGETLFLNVSHINEQKLSTAYTILSININDGWKSFLVKDEDENVYSIVFSLSDKFIVYDYPNDKSTCLSGTGLIYDF